MKTVEQNKTDNIHSPPLQVYHGANCLLTFLTEADFIVMQLILRSNL